VVMLGLLRRRLAPVRTADIRRGSACLRLRRWCGWPARIARLLLWRPAALRSARLLSTVTAVVAAPMTTTTITATTAVAVPITPATVITGAIVPIARAGAAIISAASADDHARLDHWSAIAISGLIARGVGGISGVVPATAQPATRADEARIKPVTASFIMSEKAFVD
jgi:hypothetical protein